jgi:hypothetical protein
MTSTQNRYQNRPLVINRKVVFLLIFFAISFLSGCDSPSPSPPSSVLSVRLDDGEAWLGGYQSGTQLNLEQSVGMYWNQTVWAGESESATLLVGEADQLWLDPGSGFRLASSIQSKQRPVLRLLEGRLRYRAADDRYALGTYIEVPFELRILVTDLTVSPVEPETELEIVIEDNVATLTVLNGKVAAQGNGVSETLFAAWRAIVRPGEPMEVTPPTLSDTPTPTLTIVPTRTLTPAVTATPAPTVAVTSTLTAPLTGTSTLTPQLTSSPVSSPASTLSVPTQPPPTQPPPTQPPPTQPPPTQPPPTKRPPTQPPPTQPPPTQPPPTQPPPTQPPPTEPPPTSRPTARPTAGPGG